ncbi:MAG: SEL1-like repeat protein [Micavibrio sp.]|nr:SEL1-like repeat protein [Micavibrio sp.]
MAHQDTKNPASVGASPDGAHQDIVNKEMFRAIELLGRKLERVEGERDSLARRLADVESATRDAAQGAMLPALIEAVAMPQAVATPRWMTVATAASVTFAAFAFGFVLFHPAGSSVLTPRQLDALNQLAAATPAAPAVMLASNSATGPVAAGAPDAGDADNGNADNNNDGDDDNSTAAQGDDGDDDNGGDDTAVSPDPDMQQQVSAAPAQSPAQAGISPVVVADDGIDVSKFTAPEQRSGMLSPAVESADADSPVQEVTDLEAAAPSQLALLEDRTPTPEELSAIEPAAGADTDEQDGGLAPDEAHAEPLVPVKDIAADTRLPQKMKSLQARALQGVPESQHDLAALYVSGNGAPQDYPRAIEWFTKAANNGVSNAAYNLGVMNQQGLGTPKDDVKAFAWYDKAAKAGHAEALYNIGLAYVSGAGATRDLTRAVSYFKQAANAGLPQAAYNLGVLYESTQLGAADVAKAAEWYNVAANEGHLQAKNAVARLNGASGIALVEPAAGDEGFGEGDRTPGTVQESGDSLVREIQQALAKKGDLPAEKATGYMTPQTSDAIRSWQKKLSLTADGKPTLELRDKIRAAK